MQRHRFEPGQKSIIIECGDTIMENKTVRLTDTPDAWEQFFVLCREYAVIARMRRKLAEAADKDESLASSESAIDVAAADDRVLTAVR